MRVLMSAVFSIWYERIIITGHIEWNNWENDIICSRGAVRAIIAGIILDLARKINTKKIEPPLVHK